MSYETFRVKGVRVLNIHHEHEISFFGIFTLAGSNWEKREQAGISHFAEHMFFKGTSKRTWRDINRDIAKIGADNNAYTGNDEVLYHVLAPSIHIDKAIEVVSDMFFNSSFPEDEIEKERNVIIEEKKTYEDEPSYYFFSEFSKNIMEWECGHDAIGMNDTIMSFKRNDIITYLNSKINTSNLMMVFCGDMPSDLLKSLLLGVIPDNHQYISNGNKNILTSDIWKKDISNEKICFKTQRENIEQSHISGIMNALSGMDVMTPEQAILSYAIGGGAFSLLYDRIREELGLCYYIGTGVLSVCYPHNFIFRISAMLDEKNIDKFVGETEKIIYGVMKDGIEKDVFECAKNSVLSEILRQTETAAGKAGYIIKRVFFNRPLIFRDNIERIKGARLEDCNELAKKLLDQKIKWGIMTPKVQK